MGANEFHNLAEGPDVATAFSNAYDQAVHEHGHGGYSGSLAEKRDYVVMVQQPVSQVAAYALARQFLEDQDERIDDKWGPAGAIPVCTGTRKVQVKVDGKIDDWWSSSNNDFAAVTAELKAQKLLRRGERVVGVSLNSYTQVNPRGQSRVTHFRDGTATVTIEVPGGPFERKVEIPILIDGPVDYDTRKLWEDAAREKVRFSAGESAVAFRLKQATPKVKVVDEATKGKAVTRYIIEGTQHASWASGFATQALARARSVELAKADRAHLTHFNVTAVTRREDGSPLVVTKRETVKTAAVIEVTVTKQATGPADAWLFFGTASS